MTTAEKAKSEKVTLVCNECGKRRKVSADGEFDDRCPKCGGVDWGVHNEECYRTGDCSCGAAEKAR